MMKLASPSALSERGISVDAPSTRRSGALVMMITSPTVLQIRRLAPQVSRLEDAPAEIAALLAAVSALVHDIDAIDMNGAVLRCTLEEALDPDFDDHVDALLKALAIDIAQLDIVLDLGAPAYSPQGPLVGVIRAALNGARMLSARSVVVMAASFPETMPAPTAGAARWNMS